MTKHQLAMGPYRYELTRSWDDRLPEIIWVMHNPSTADGIADDATLRRIIRFSTDWGHGSLRVVNLFAHRTPYPQELRRRRAAGEDVVGPENDATIKRVSSRIENAFDTRVMAAWGCMSWPWQRARAEAVLSFLPRPVLCLGVTNGGDPRHPLRVAAKQGRVFFRVHRRKQA